MNIFLSRKNLYIVVLGYSILAIIFALYLEYYLNYQPCKLCLYQRVPFILAIFISFIGFNFPKKDEVLILLITTFAVGMIISGYHFGIENNIFEEGLLCDVGRIESTNTTDLLKSLKDMPISCKEVTFKIFGLSLATFNTLLNFFLVSILIYKLKHYGKN